MNNMRIFQCPVTSILHPNVSRDFFMKIIVVTLYLRMYVAVNDLVEEAIVTIEILNRNKCKSLYIFVAKVLC